MTGMLGQGFLVSLQIFAFTLVGSLPLGMLVAFARMSKFRPLALLARAYISIMRGTPLMLQMFAIYFMPYYVFGISLTTDSKWYATIVAFIINYAAYFAEILGYSPSQTFVRIVLPQVVKRILPAVTNEVITLVKDTSLAFSIGVIEMFTVAKQLVAAQVSMAPFVIAAAFYWVANFAIDLVAGRIERRLDYYHD